MRKITNFLMPLAVLVFFGACMLSVFCLFAVSISMFGMQNELPLMFYRRMNIPLISVSIPLMGIILFAAILLGLPGKTIETIAPTKNKSAANLSVRVSRQKEKSVDKAA